MFWHSALPDEYLLSESMIEYWLGDQFDDGIVLQSRILKAEKN